MDLQHPGGRCCSGLCLLILTAALTVMANPLSAAEIIKDIAVKNVGSGRVDQSFVLFHVRAKTGEEYNPVLVSRDVKKLLATGRFSFVTVEAEGVSDGIKLVYSVSNKLKIEERVVIKGAEHFREATIRNWLGLLSGDLVDDQTLGVKSLRILEEYRKDYYPDVSVKWKIEETIREEGKARVLLIVKEGKRARLKRMSVIGNEKVDAEVLRNLLKHHDMWDPRWFFRKRRYDEDDLETARRTVRDYYLGKGFLDVVVESPVIEKKEEGVLGVKIKVAEGSPYKVGGISLEGITLFPESELAKLVRMERGDVADMAAIRRAAMRLRDYYGSRGYANTIVRHVLDPDVKKGVVDIVFSFKEGQLVKIRNILIRGNTRTRDKVIRRELLVYPGDKLNEVKVRSSERLISNLGFFSMARSYQTPTDVPDMRDLVFEVEEKRTGHFMMGAGFSSIDKLMGFVELTQGNFDVLGWPNFTGAGQKLRLSAQFGTKRQDYKISFVEPWFMNRPLSLGFDVYQSVVDYTDYDIERSGASLTVGKRLSRAHRTSIQYRLERVDFSEISDTNEYTEVETGDSFYFDDEEKSIKSSLRLSLTHNTCDNPLVPTRGTRASLYGKLTGGILGFDTDVYNMGFRAKHYIPVWWNHVLSIRGKYEVVEAYSDTDDVPLADRLFLGGGRTLRGFKYREVGPKAIRTFESDGVEEMYHRPIGGKSLALASIEYTVPIVSGVRLAGFYDTGNVWSDPYHLDASDLASSAGVGVRMDVPGFPIRVDRGWVIKADDDLTEDDSWVLWIGYDY